MADRFDEMAQAFCIEHNLAVDAEVAALLRKVHADGIRTALAAVQNQQSYGDYTEAAYCIGVDHCIAAVKRLVP